MALHYLTPTEQVLAQFTSEEQSRLSARAVDNLSNLEQKNHNLFHYNLPAYAKRKLSEKGLYLSPYAYETHSHPVCKTLESYIVNVKLVNYVDDSFNFVGFKQSKMQVLRRNSKLKLAEVLNRYVVSHDIQRYGADAYFQAAKKEFPFKSTRGVLPLHLNSIIPSCLKKKKRRVFLYDELHYWTLRDIHSFLEVVQPELLIGTFVFPKEALFGCKESLNPWAYEFKIKGSTLVFAPDGQWQESYEQPMEAGKLLLVNEIICGDTRYSVQVKDSIFAHCIVIITKTTLPSEKYRFFSDFDACSGKELAASGGLNGRDCIIPVRHQTVLSIFKYLRTLKKPDLQSAMAKHRQLVDDPSGAEIRFMEDLSKFFLDHCEKHNLIEDGFFQKKINEFYLNLPVTLQKIFGGFKDLTLGVFVEKLKPLVLEVKCRSYNPIYFSSSSICAYDENIDGEKDPECFITDRVPQEYRSNFHPEPPFNQLHFCNLSNDTFIQIFRDIVSFLEYRLSGGKLKQICLDLLKGDEKFFFKCLEFSSHKFHSFCQGLNFHFLKDCFMVALKSHILEKERSIQTCKPLLLTNDFTADKKREKARKEMPGKTTLFIYEDLLRELRSRIDEIPALVEAEAERVEPVNDFVCDPSILASNLGLLDTQPIEGVTETIDSASFEEPIKKEVPSSYDLCKISDLDESKMSKLSYFDVPADGSCFWHSVAPSFFTTGPTLKEKVKLMFENEPEKFSNAEDIEEQLQEGVFAEIDVISYFCLKISVKLLLETHTAGKREQMIIEPLNSEGESFTMCFLKLDLDSKHYMSALPKEGCVIRAIANSLGQVPNKVLAVLSENGSDELLEELKMGYGIPYSNLEDIFKTFDIEAHLHGSESSEIFNEGGSRVFHYNITNDHIEFVKPETKTKDLTVSSRYGISQKNLEDFHAFFSKHLNVIDYVPNFERAKKIDTSLMKGLTGKISSTLFDKQGSLLNSCPAKGSTRIYVSVGVFGSGKSYRVKEFIKRNPHRRMTVISPRRNLKEDFLKSLGLKFGTLAAEKYKVEVLTFEVALKRKFRDQHIFIDELQLFPPGYLDLLIHIAGPNVDFVCMGDPCQSSYDSDSDRHVFLGDKGDLDNILEGRSYQYVCKSWRFINPMFVGRLPCIFEESVMNGIKESWVSFESFEDYCKSDESKLSNSFLVSSFMEKKVVHINCGGKVRCLTFGESTGLTFDYCTVLLSADSQLTDEKRWLVALTRARKNIFFVNLSGSSLQDFVNVLYPSVANDFFTSRSKVESLKRLLPGKPTLVKEFSRLGSDEVDREERLSGDPWLKSKIFLGQRATLEESEVAESELQPFSMKVHCPVGIAASAFVEISEKMKAKELREKRIDDIVTEQFSEQLVKGGLEITNHCDNFAAIYPRHKAGDTATFVLAARKRLRFSTPQKEASKFRSALPIGNIMFKKFLQFIKLRPNWNNKLFEEAVNEFEIKKLGKSAATIENHSGRSDPDWPIEQALIFMKSQLCTKFDNRFIDAKAGQTLACFHHDVLVRLAPYIRYIEKKVLEVLPKNFYIHTGKNFDDLNDWVLANDFGSICTESDYTAFDASQDATILAFEFFLMRYLHIPNELIEDYKYLKMFTHSKLGMFAVMRFTGEAPTFLFNTLANMVFTFMQYDLNGKESICFAGDDMCGNRRFRVTNKYEDVLSKLKLKAKVQFVSQPTFCGWCLTPFGIYKRPSLVRERFMIALTADSQKKKLADCIDNYALEVSYAYKLSERLVSVMSEKELEDHFHCVRLIVKNLNLCKSEVKDLFRKQERCLSPERV